MKKNNSVKYITKILFFVVLGIFLSCGKQKLFKKMTYEGVVYDSLGGKPVPGITVDLKACVPHDGRDECDECFISTTVTDANGHFSMTFKKARSDRYGIFLKGLPYSDSFKTGEDELLGKNKKLYMTELP